MALKGSQFSFLIRMIVLLFFNNIAFIIYLAYDNKKKTIVDDPNSTEAQKLFWCLFDTFFDWIRYCTFNVAHWVFAIKYWIISREMPKAISGKLLVSQNQQDKYRISNTSSSQNRRSSKFSSFDMSQSIHTLETSINQVNRNEQIYRLLRGVGVFLNVLISTWYSFEYFEVAYHSGEDDYDNSMVIYAAYSTDFCNVLAACFIGDALRRIWSALDEQEGLRKNEKFMIVHLILFSLYCISGIIKTVFWNIYLGDPTNTYKEANSWIAYLVNIFCLFIVQLIMCFLFFKFSKPVNTIITRTSDGLVTIRCTIKDTPQVRKGNYLFMTADYEAADNIISHSVGPNSKHADLLSSLMKNDTPDDSEYFTKKSYKIPDLASVRTYSGRVHIGKIPSYKPGEKTAEESEVVYSGSNDRKRSWASTSSQITPDNTTSFVDTLKSSDVKTVKVEETIDDNLQGQLTYCWGSQEAFLRQVVFSQFVKETSVAGGIQIPIPVVVPSSIKKQSFKQRDRLEKQKKSVESKEPTEFQSEPKVESTSRESQKLSDVSSRINSSEVRCRLETVIEEKYDKRMKSSGQLSTNSAPVSSELTPATSMHMKESGDEFGFGDPGTFDERKSTSQSLISADKPSGY